MPFKCNLYRYAEVFIHRNVGKFPAVMQGLALGHERKGDILSALVTAEWYGHGGAVQVESS